MLYKVVIENFFSIAEAQEISFIVHANAPDMPCFRQPYPGEDSRLPAVIGFFGANASGKSTILRAITSAVVFALHSFYWKDEIDVFFQPYRQKKWWGKPTKILIEFDGQLSAEELRAKFRYELHVSHEANSFSNKKILYEALSYAPKGKFRRLFERHEQRFDFKKEFSISASSEKKKVFVPTRVFLARLQN